MDYYSVKVVSSNENGDLEVSFEMRRTLLDRLLRRRARVHTFVLKSVCETGPFLVWEEKESGRVASHKWDNECRGALAWAECTFPNTAKGLI